jgi:hypothetical protein
VRTVELHSGDRILVGNVELEFTLGALSRAQATRDEVLA